MRKQFNRRLPSQTIRQIADIARALQDSEAHALIIAVDRQHQELYGREQPDGQPIEDLPATIARVQQTT